MGFLLAALGAIVVYAGLIVCVTISQDDTDKALNTQCTNTAHSIHASTYTFDKHNHKCNIVTVDGKLVSF